MMTTCIKRLRKELQNLDKNKDDHIILEANPENIREWTATLTAPPDSAYDGYLFRIHIEVGLEYPLVSLFFS